MKNIRKALSLLLALVLCVSLCVPAAAASGFNASLDISRSADGNVITVEVQDSSVLSQKQPTLTIPVETGFNTPVVLFAGDNTATKATITDDGVSFTVADGGTYYIINGLTEESDTATCTEDGYVSYLYNGVTYTIPSEAKGHDFSDTGKSTCANCDEPNPDCEAPTEPETPEEPEVPTIPVIPVAPVSPAPGGSERDEEEKEEVPALPFTDVKAGDWYYDSVAYVYEKGLMDGMGYERFYPTGLVTRAMAVTVLWRMTGEPAASSAGSFKDVPSGAWYSEAVAWAASAGVVEGYGAEKFGPTNFVTREQLAAIFWRYAKHMGMDVSVGEDTNILSYTDAFEISDWAFPALQWACGEGIINGKGGGVLDPGGSANRAQLAQILMNFCE